MVWVEQILCAACEDPTQRRVTQRDIEDIFRSESRVRVVMSQVGDDTVAGVRPPLLQLLRFLEHGCGCLCRVFLLYSSSAVPAIALQ